MRNPSDPPKMAIWNDGETMAALPEMRRGGGTVAWVEVVGRIRQPNSPLWGYRSGDNAYSTAREHLSPMRRQRLRAHGACRRRPRRS